MHVAFGELLLTFWLRPVNWLHFVHEIYLYSCPRIPETSEQLMFSTVGDFAWHLSPFIREMWFVDCSYNCKGSDQLERVMSHVTRVSKVMLKVLALKIDFSSQTLTFVFLDEMWVWKLQSSCGSPKETLIRYSEKKTYCFVPYFCTCVSVVS